MVEPSAEALTAARDAVAKMGLTAAICSSDGDIVASDVAVRAAAPLLVAEQQARIDTALALADEWERQAVEARTTAVHRDVVIGVKYDALERAKRAERIAADLRAALSGENV